VSPNRPLLLSGVLLGSLAAGLGMAFLLSQLKPTFFDARSLRSYTGMPMLGTVSMLTDSVTRSRRRQSVLAFSTTSVLYLVLFGSLIAWYAAKTLLVVLVESLSWTAPAALVLAALMLMVYDPPPLFVATTGAVPLIVLTAPAPAASRLIHAEPL
jgi:hypothetical protein